MERHIKIPGDTLEKKHHAWRETLDVLFALGYYWRGGSRSFAERYDGQTLCDSISPIWLNLRDDREGKTITWACNSTNTIGDLITFDELVELLPIYPGSVGQIEIFKIL